MPKPTFITRLAGHVYIHPSFHPYTITRTPRTWETPQTQTLSDRYFNFKTGQVLFCVRGKEQRSNYKKRDNLMMHSPKISHQCRNATGFLGKECISNFPVMRGLRHFRLEDIPATLKIWWCLSSLRQLGMSRHRGSSKDQPAPAHRSTTHPYNISRKTKSVKK